MARVYLRERSERLQQIGIVACLSGVAAISGATGDGVAEFYLHEAKRQQVAVVGIEDRLAVGDQKGLIDRALGAIGVDRTDLSPVAGRKRARRKRARRKRARRKRVPSSRSSAGQVCGHCAQQVWQWRVYDH